MPSVDPELTLPKRQTAIVAQAPGKLAIQHDAPVPALAPDMAIVKMAAVAINPADAKMLDYSAAPGAIHGYDFAGTIVALGSEALELGHLSVGDRVAGMVHGMNKLQPDVGAFAEYVGACADLLLRIPDHMSFEEGASFGTGVATATMSLFSELAVPTSIDELPKEERPSSDEGAEFVLVAGGSSASGTRAIQLLKMLVTKSRLLLPVFAPSALNHGQILTVYPYKCWSASDRNVLARQLRTGPPFWRREGIRLPQSHMRRRHQGLHRQRTDLYSRLHLSIRHHSTLLRVYGPRRRPVRLTRAFPGFRRSDSSADHQTILGHGTQYLRSQSRFGRGIWPRGEAAGPSFWRQSLCRFSDPPRPRPG